jgi:hypothetical protein
MNWSDGTARVIAGQRPEQLCTGRLRNGAVLPVQFQRPASRLAGPQQLAAGGRARSGPSRGTLAVRPGHRVALADRNEEERR